MSFVGKPNPELREKIVRWRNDTASTLGNPPYTVLHNATIDRIVAVAPKSAAELGRIKGVGPQCLSSYGEQILAIVEGRPGVLNGQMLVAKYTVPSRSTGPPPTEPIDL